MLIYYLLEFPKNSKAVKWGSFDFSVSFNTHYYYRSGTYPCYFLKHFFFLSGFEDESDSTHAKQQMEVVRSEISCYHWWMYAFLFQAKAMTWINLQLKIFWLFILCRFFGFFWNWKCNRLENGLLLDKVFVAVIKIGIQASRFVKRERISFRWTHVHAENFPNAHKSVLKAIGHWCLLLAMGDRTPPYLKELIFWVVSAALGSITCSEVQIHLS